MRPVLRPSAGSLAHSFTGSFLLLAAGPDTPTHEFVRALDDRNGDEILRHINACWPSKTVPAQCKHAIVVPIHNGGTTSLEDPSHYRPISLRN